LRYFIYILSGLRCLFDLLKSSEHVSQELIRGSHFRNPGTLEHRLKRIPLIANL